MLYLCYQYDRMYEQTVILLGIAGRLVSHNYAKTYATHKASALLSHDTDWRDV